MDAAAKVAVPIITVIALFAVGLDLAPRDFAGIRPRAIVAGLLAPAFLLPALALALVAVFRPAPDVAAGLLLVAACPIGGISNVYSYLARASTVLSVALTTTSSLLAVVTIPALNQILETASGRSLGFSVPVPTLLGQLVLLLGLPVSCGMWLRSRRAELAQRLRPAFQRMGFVLLGLLLSLLVGTDVSGFVGKLRQTVPLSASFIAGSFAVGWVTSRLLVLDRAEHFTLATEFATRNIAVATAIAVTLVGRVEFGLFAMVYFLTELPLMLIAIAAYRGTSQPAPSGR